jgi:hypothetical protein
MNGDHPEHSMRAVAWDIRMFVFVIRGRQAPNYHLPQGRVPSPCIAPPESATIPCTSTFKEVRMLTVGRDDVVTTRWSKDHPIHVARFDGDRSHAVALCGKKLRTADWVTRKKGSFVDEEELCPRCVEQGGVAMITRGGLLGRLHLPQVLSRRKSGANRS